VNEDSTYLGMPRWLWDKLFMVILASPLLYNTNAARTAAEKGVAQNSMHFATQAKKQDALIVETVGVKKALVKNTAVAEQVVEAAKAIPEAAVVAADKLVESKKSLPVTQGDTDVRSP
jgi:hypothetical protein